MARYGWEYNEELTYEEREECRDEMIDILYEREIERRWMDESIRDK